MSASPPKVGFVSLGCPKALTDSELILTQLRAEGYETSKSYDGADLVIVNTCGFIDDAVKESLDTIGEALAANGRVIVTGCLGAKAGADGGNLVRQAHPKVLAVTGPHATQEVMDAVHRHVPKPHDPFIDLVPEARGVAGIKLTPRHYAYLKISEGCNHRCTFCIIPSMRGDLVSRPIGEVLLGSACAVRQRREGAAGDQPGHQRLRRGREVPHRLLRRPPGEDAHDRAVRGTRQARRAPWRLGAAALRVPLPARGRGAAADGRGAHPALPRRALPARAPGCAEAHEAARQRRAQPRAAAKWREVCPQIVVRSTFIAGFPGETEAEFETLLDFVREAQIDRAGCFAYSPVDGAAANQIPGMLPQALRDERRVRASWRWPRRCPSPSCSSVWARPCRCWWTMHPRWAARAVSAAAMPMRPRSTAP